MQVLNIFHVLIAIALIGFVLIQRGQGATAGAAFGSGASGTVFGARGAGNFLSRSTWVLAALFCAISLTMAVLVSRMMQPTAPDLGVVATEPAAQVQEQAPASELSVGPGEPSAMDVPAFEQAIEQSGEQSGEQAIEQSGEQAIEQSGEQGGEDLPAPAADPAPDADGN